jgi:hypothetical protein
MITSLGDEKTMTKDRRWIGRTGAARVKALRREPKRKKTPAPPPFGGGRFLCVLGGSALTRRKPRTGARSTYLVSFSPI